MPRKPRLEVEGLLYHVIARGIERREIFRERRDYDFFLERLGEVLIGTQTEVYAFCLMPNHFHLLLKPKSVPLSTTMRRLLTGYAVNFNKTYGRAGHLFQNRYKAIICQEDAYLLELIRYIHLNPVRSGVVKTMEELGRYPFSGHRALLGKKKYDWYAKNAILSNFAKSQANAGRAYLEFMTDGLSMGKDPIFSGGGLKRSLGFPEEYPKEKQAYDDRIIGASDFVLALIGKEEDDKEKSGDIGAQDLIIKASKSLGLTPEEICGKGRAPKVRQARALIAFLCATRLGLSFAEVARTLNVHCSTVSRMLAKGEGFSKTIDWSGWFNG